MKPIAKFIRLMHIQLVLARHGLDKVIFALPWFSPVRFASVLNPWNWFRQGEFDRGQAIRHALIELGPIFVKFGQALSTRPDLLPDDIIDELSLLQDKVPPFSGEKAKQIIEKSYDRSVEDVFECFNQDVLASASIAQVHAATLFSGQDVVVKVLRPGIKRLIKRDIQLLYTTARTIEKYWPDAKRLRPIEVVAEFEKTILDELDLMREAASASQLRRNFIDSNLLYVPEIHWSYTNDHVLVMERIRGIPITNINELKANNVDIKILAEKGVEIFFTQVFS